MDFVYFLGALERGFIKHHRCLSISPFLKELVIIHYILSGLSGGVNSQVR